MKTQTDPNKQTSLKPFLSPPTEASMEEATDTAFTANSDLTQQLLHRYGKSSAPQHSHLCATAAATRSIIQSEQLPLTPLSYFAATIDAISDTSKSLDADAISALSSFLAIVLPLVPEKSIAPLKAAEAVAVIVELVEKPRETVSVSSVRALVKCVGILVEFCDLEDWHSVKLGFKALLKFSIDKRPKVRKCAQDCVVKVFKSFQSSVVRKKASKSILSLVETYLPHALKLAASRSSNGSKDDVLSKPEHLEVLHMLNLLKHLVPHLSPKVRSKVVSELLTLMRSKLSVLTRHIFDVLEVILLSEEPDAVVPEAESIIETLAAYVSSRKNPVDTLHSAATLIEKFLSKFHDGEPSNSSSHLSLVIGSIAGLLSSEATASQASNILKELISHHFDKENLRSTESQLGDDDADGSGESSLIKLMCSILLNVLNTGSGTPNEHTLAVISVLFVKLGEISFIYMKEIVTKLASYIEGCPQGSSRIKHVQECIGSATVSMGAEKLLSLLPISFNTKDLTCSNIWLIPILKNYISGASLGFFMEHVVPLAESFQRASRKVKKSVISQDLQAHAQGCWELLPAFCRYPIDTHKNFASLAKLLIPLIQKDSFMIENVAVSLQELVNQNKSVVGSDESVAEVSEDPMMSDGVDSKVKLVRRPSYSQKTASKNIRALVACSEMLLHALTDVFFESSPEQRTYLKDAVACLASVADSSVTKRIFISSLERFGLLNDVSECRNLDASVDKEKINPSSVGKATERCLILELASTIIGPASNDLIDIIFSLIKQSLQEADETIDKGAYRALTKVLEESSWLSSSKYVELMDLLLVLKPPIDIETLTSRFICFKALLLHSLARSSDGEDAKAFLILNEIILTLKDAKEKGEDRRKVAYDILQGISSSLRKSSRAISDGPYHKLINMIMGYLSGSSPHITSGAVSALSVVIYNDSGICQLIPDLIPSVLELLHSKAIEVIKAVLGFMKVLVLSLQVKDLLNFLPDVLNGVLPWSTVSRHHFKSKVTVILEIMMRRCGFASVKALAPEKYKTFVKDVLENRRGNKTSSKEEAVTTETEPNSANSAPTGWQKRKHTEEDSAGSRKRRRDDRWNGADRSSNEHQKSDVKREVKQFGRDRFKDGRSQGSRMNKKRTFDSSPVDGKAKIGMIKGKGFKKNGTDARPRHKMGGKNSQKSKK